MGNPQKRKKRTAANKLRHKQAKGKHYERALDQIHTDLLAPGTLLSQPLDEDLPGLGQFYCLECSRYFTCTVALHTHYKSKTHKKRLRELQQSPHSQAAAERYAGLTTQSRDSTMREA